MVLIDMGPWFEALKHENRCKAWFKVPKDRTSSLIVGYCGLDCFCLMTVRASAVHCPAAKGGSPRREVEDRQMLKRELDGKVQMAREGGP